ncbi:uncharacterized protein [Pyrus communis]|uniref:uncharacterized protein n=1 Tax=Pyrus communis TaxID=23211 RepID=UPI0035BF014B
MARMFMKMMQKKCPKRPSLNKRRVRPVIQLGLNVRRLKKEKGVLPRMIMQKYMEELTRQGELTLVRVAKYEADKAREEAIATAIEREFQANERERELLRQEREHVREERMVQRDREILNMPLQGKSPNSKFFWKSEKANVVRMRRAREARARQDGPSTTREDHPSTTNWLNDDEYSSFCNRSP